VLTGTHARTQEASRAQMEGEGGRQTGCPERGVARRWARGDSEAARLTRGVGTTVGLGAKGLCCL